MPFKDLGEFLEEQTLTLPIRGKSYTFPDISAERWLKLERLGPEIGRAVKAELAGNAYDVDLELVGDDDQDALMRDLCGDTLQEMLDDGVRASELKLVLATLIVFHLLDSDHAELVWNSGGEAPAPSRAARRQAGASPASSKSRPKTKPRKSPSKPSSASGSPSRGGS
jgi:hypothetical protein